MTDIEKLIKANALVDFIKEQRAKVTGAYSKGRNDGLNVAISAIRNEEICPAVDAVSNDNVGSKWIPVSERLPDTQEYDWVLAQITMLPSCIYCVPVVAELRADGWYDAYDNLIDGKREKVTHWMPLPEPPKEV